MKSCQWIKKSFCFPYFFSSYTWMQINFQVWFFWVSISVDNTKKNSFNLSSMRKLHSATIEPGGNLMLRVNNKSQPFFVGKNKEAYFFLWYTKSSWNFHLSKVIIIHFAGMENSIVLYPWIIFFLGQVRNPIICSMKKMIWFSIYFLVENWQYKKETFNRRIQ